MADDARILEIDDITTGGVQGEIGLEQEVPASDRHLGDSFDFLLVEIPWALPDPIAARCLIPIPDEIPRCRLNGKGKREKHPDHELDRIPGQAGK